MGWQLAMALPHLLQQGRGSLRRGWKLAADLSAEDCFPVLVQLPGAAAATEQQTRFPLQ